MNVDFDEKNFLMKVVLMNLYFTALRLCHLRVAVSEGVRHLQTMVPHAHEIALLLRLSPPLFLLLLGDRRSSSIATAYVSLTALHEYEERVWNLYCETPRQAYRTNLHRSAPALPTAWTSLQSSAKVEAPGPHHPWATRRAGPDRAHGGRRQTAARRAEGRGAGHRSREVQ